MGAKIKLPIKLFLLALFGFCSIWANSAFAQSTATISPWRQPAGTLNYEITSYLGGYTSGNGYGMNIGTLYDHPIWLMDGVRDGNSGYVSPDAAGYLDLNFNGCVMIGEILIWNNTMLRPRNNSVAVKGGIKTMVIEFYNSNNILISTSPVQALTNTNFGVNRADAQSFNWNKLKIPPVVAAKIRLKILDSFDKPDHGVELREIEVIGRRVNCPNVAQNNNSKSGE